MENKRVRDNMSYDVIIIGAGPAGLGVAVVFEKMGVNYLVLEKERVGATFAKWPKETRLITPSFSGHSFGMPDLNAIVPSTSPAYSLMTEHPTGSEYQDYLLAIQDYFELNIQEMTEVQEVKSIDGIFEVKTEKHSFTTGYVVWAAGEYNTPNQTTFRGAELTTHYSNIPSFRKLERDNFVIIGAYESGFDSAVHLAERGKKVVLIDNGNYLMHQESDSSYALSPYTRDRIEKVIDKIEYMPNSHVMEVIREKERYSVKLKDGRKLTTSQPPINCTGFEHGMDRVAEYFSYVSEYPKLTDYDESTKTKGIYLVGPKVKHERALFCFIYKYRQRFAIVARKIAMELNVPQEVVQEVVREYQDSNFYLDDLSCCTDECKC